MIVALKSTRISLFLLLACAVLAGPFFFSWNIPAAQAQTQAEQIREINNLLRSAERHFHGGRFEEARQELDQAESILQSAEAEDTPQIRGARSRYDRLSQNVQRRMGETATSAPAAPATSAAPAARMSGADARNYRLLDQEMRRTRNRLTDHRWWEISQSDRDGRLKEAGRDVDNYRSKLDGFNSDLDPALLESEAVQNSEALLADIQTLISKRSSESEPVEEASPAAAEALALAQKLQELHGSHYARFQGIHGNSMVHGTTPADQLKAGRDAVNQLDALERDVLPALQPVLGEIADKYGQRPAAINNALRDLGVKTDFDAGSRFSDLHRGLENVEKTRRASSQDLARRATNIMTGVERLAEEIRISRLEDAKEFLLLAQAFDTADQDVNRLMAELDVMAAEMSARIEKEIDARTWAGDVSGFPGPGSTADLSGAALDFIRKHPNWNPSGRGTEIIAVSVRGPWDVGTKDLFGRVVQWRLPIHVAITNNQLKKDNVSRVYELSVLTPEGAPNNVEKKPPFVEYWVGNSWNMRINNVPAGSY